MLLFAMALAAQDATEEVAGWTVATDFRKDDCAMSARLQSGGDVSFHWRPRKRVGVMVYRSPDFKSLKQDRKYTIQVAFEKGGKLDNGWGDRTATGTIGRDGMQGLMIVFSGREILSDLAASAKIGFWYKNKLVGAVPLDGSAKAVAAMRRCEAAVLERVARDPFAE